MLGMREFLIFLNGSYFEEQIPKIFTELIAENIQIYGYTYRDLYTDYLTQAMFGSKAEI